MTSNRGAGAFLTLPALVVLLPFEPLAPALTFVGTELSWLEAAAGVALLILLWTSRHRTELLRAPPLPLVLLGTFVAVNALSAVLADEHPTLARRFVLRMVAAWVWLSSFGGLFILFIAQSIAAAIKRQRGRAPVKKRKSGR